MTHDRPYKRAIDHEAAVRELRRHAGTQFDPELVSLFCDLFASHAPLPDKRVEAITGTVRNDRRPRRRGGGAARRALASPPRSRSPTARRRSPPRAEPRGDGAGEAPISGG